MIKITDKKRFSLFVGAIILLIAAIIGGIILWKKYQDNKKPGNQPQVYEALVNIVDQKAKDPVEDARSSLKFGDVIAYFPEGHSWSDTEKNSYLIIKLKLKPADATKLTEAETKAIKNVEKGPDGKDIGPGTETVRARKYRLDIYGFDMQKFLKDHQQPFPDKIFGASIIDKK